MNVQLFKVRVAMQDGNYFYTFYIKSESGIVTRINSNAFTTKDGKQFSNYTTLVALAKEVKSVDAIKGNE